MSHFAVMVVLDEYTEEALQKKLQPYHKYECTGVDDEYVIDVDMTDKVVKEFDEDKEKYGDDSSMWENIDEYAEEWHGCDKTEDGRYVRHTNPNKRWDWWTVGGRWSDLLLLKDGTRADYAQKKDIDFDGKIEETKKRYLAQVTRFNEIVAGRECLSFKQCKEQTETIEQARELYHSQPAIQDINNAMQDEDDEMPFILFGDIFEHMCNGDVEKYVKTAEFDALGTYALLMDVPKEHPNYLEIDGEEAKKPDPWHEKGRMGWWGMSSDEKDDWPEQFMSLFKLIRDDQWVVIVDCHI